MNEYTHAMDHEKMNTLSIPQDYIGISTPPMRDQLEGMKTRIFQGLSHIELGFMGTGKGSMSQGSVTPEMYGKDQRQAIRELAKINEVTLSTHATVGVQGIAGRTQEGFSREAQEAGLSEIRRTIDFAAETARGGPIVFHAGEFPRPVSTYEEFEGYPGEKKKGMVFIANKETGQIHQLRRETPFSFPVIEKDNQGNDIYEDSYEDPEHRRLPKYVRTADGEIKFETRTIQELIEQKRNQNHGLENKRDDELAIEIYRDYRQKERKLSEGEQRRYDISAEQIGKNRRELQRIKEAYQRQLQDPRYAGDPHFRDVIKGEIIEDLRRRGLIDERELRTLPERALEIHNDPFGYLNRQLQEEKRHEESLRQIAISYGQRSYEEDRMIQNIDTLEKVGLERSNDGIARAALYAWKKEKTEKLDKPLFVAPENIWPDTGYGSHPEELKKIIQGSRGKMVERLTKKEIDGVPNPDYDRNVTPQQAVKIAEDHIRATFDIGHANIWRKYFKGDEQGFKDWMGKQIDDLNKNNIIGHVHISDNFGFEDEHVTPGEGNAPIGEFTKKMREGGFQGKMIIEPAHQDYQAWTGFMRFAHTPVYSRQSWTEIEGSYLSQGSGSPTYMVGAYTTDAGIPEENRDIRFWSRLPIE